MATTTLFVALMLAQAGATAPVAAPAKPKQQTELTTEQTMQYQSIVRTILEARLTLANAQLAARQADEQAKAGQEALQKLAAELKAGGCTLSEDQGKPVCAKPAQEVKK